MITALSTISPPLISRAIYPAGAKHLLPLLELCLPGLDVNDPIKTMSTAMFVIQAVTSVMIDDLTRPELANGDAMDVEDKSEPVELADGEEPKLSKKQEDDLVRLSTAGFPDWVSNFFRQVLLVFEALPEPGKGSRNGGKMEDQMTQTLIVSGSLDPDSLMLMLVPFVGRLRFPLLATLAAIVRPRAGHRLQRGHFHRSVQLGARRVATCVLLR